MHLTQLTLSKNQFVFLPEDIGGLVLLTALDVTYNNLTRLPQSVGKVRIANIWRLYAAPLIAMSLSQLCGDSLSARRGKYLHQITPGGFYHAKMPLMEPLKESCA